ncbi:MAG: hypothetical protein H7A10_01670 [Oceanospirillaceae bacterium]|nr:hypothetical protein [Oceanospirillaceae bacterium]
MFKKLAVLSFICLVSAVSFAGGPKENDITYQQCREIKEQMDYYQKLRRSGGSASDMEYWRDRLKSLKDKDRQLNCRKYGMIKT